MRRATSGEEASVPVEFRCPITQMVMKKPVVATDGHSYELKAMQKWLLKKQTSPVTGKPLASTNLIINQNLIHGFSFVNGSHTPGMSRL